MKRQRKQSENYLERKPKRAEHIKWSCDDAGLVTLALENRGIFNFLAQKILNKPEISYIHLDEMGSFVWPLLDGNIDLISIGKKVKEKFGENCEPLYERLAKYITILESYRFITFQNEENK